MADAGGRLPLHLSCVPVDTAYVRRGVDAIPRWVVIGRARARPTRSQSYATAVLSGSTDESLRLWGYRCLSQLLNRSPKEVKQAIASADREVCTVTYRCSIPLRRS